jgi:dTMP kinase
MFVTVEGIEGSGKSTLLQSLATRLRDAGYTVTSTREPGGTRLGDAVREVALHKHDLRISPVAEALLMNASRAALVSEVIRPALEAGDIVLCDRYADSTMAYQGYGRGLDLTMLQAMCDSATGGLRPHLTFLLDIPSEVSRSRVIERGQADRMDSQDLEFYARARAGFLELAAGDARWHVLDALQPADVLLEAALSVVLAKNPR